MLRQLRYASRHDAATPVRVYAAELLRHLRRLATLLVDKADATLPALDTLPPCR